MEEFTMSVAEVKDLTFSYGKKKILDGLSLTVEAGECVGIVGSNGCGKSTLLNLLAGVKKPRSGQIYYNGRNACKERGLFRSAVGFVPQENTLFEELTVRDNLKLWYLDKAAWKQELESGILAELDLTGLLKKQVKKLSGGQKKRVSICCALAGSPSVLILDEPGASLDLEAKEEIGAYLTAYKKRGGTVLIATHEEQELNLCDRLMVLRYGALAQIDKGLRGAELAAEFSKGR